MDAAARLKDPVDKRFAGKLIRTIASSSSKDEIKAMLILPSTYGNMAPYGESTTLA